MAARLSEGLPDQQVLLLDAGGTNADQSLENFAERHWTLAVPGYNWGYKTAPQQELKSRAIDASRGKGLGGSTAINFCVYTRGPKADYDHWAEVVEDDSWSWQYSVERFKKVHIFRDRGQRADSVSLKNSTSRLANLMPL